jgi:phosphate transport system substrate-binding protein
MPAAAIKNNAGRYEYPNLSNISNAASTVHGLGGTREVHIVNPPRTARSAYPISTFTYVIVKGNDPLNNGGDLKSFITYAISGGQSFAPRLDFVPLPSAVKRADQAALGLIH